MRRTKEIPPPLDDDLEDVQIALSAASTLWRRGEMVEALKWLRRAAGEAAERDADQRAVQLFKVAADISSDIDAAKNAAAVAPQPQPPASRPPALDFDDVEETVIRPETMLRRALMAIDPDYARRTSYPSDSGNEADDEVEPAPANDDGERRSRTALAHSVPRPPPTAVVPGPAPAKSDIAPAKPNAAPPITTLRGGMPTPARPAPKPYAAPSGRRAIPAPKPNARAAAAKPIDPRRNDQRRGEGRTTKPPLPTPTSATKPRGRRDSTTPAGGIRPNEIQQQQARRAEHAPRPKVREDPLAVTQKRSAAAIALQDRKPTEPAIEHALPALRVALSIDADGAPQLRFLGPTDEAPTQSANALLVASSPADAKLFAEIFAASRKKS